MSTKRLKLSELSELIGARLSGNGAAFIEGIASLEDADPHDISFLNNSRYAEQITHTAAGGVIVPKDFDGSADTTLLFASDVNESLDRLLSFFAPPSDQPQAGVHPAACVDSSAKLCEDVAIGAGAVIGANVLAGAGTVIWPGCVIGRDVQIGKNCHLLPNVVINQGCLLGNNVIIHANSTIGMDGFGYRMIDGEHRKIAHIGIVVIEDDVEIGSNSCVDRAKFGRTVVGRGTKIDNLVQIAHNVKIGHNCIIASQVVVAGSSELGDYVVMSGQSGVSDHVKVGNGAMLGPRTGVFGQSEVKPGEKLMGTPPRPFRTHLREVSLVGKLPEMHKAIKQLQKQINKNAISKDHI